MSKRKKTKPIKPKNLALESLYTSGLYKPKTIKSKKAYNRKKNNVSPDM